MPQGIGVNHSWRDGVDVDVLLDEFHTKVARERFQCGLAGTHCHVVWQHALGSVAGQAHDPARAAFFHQRSCSLRREQERPRIDVHGPVPTLGLLAHDRAVVAGSRAVDKDVQSTPGRRNLLKETIKVADVSHVGLDGPDASSKRASLPGCRLGGQSSAKVVDYEVGAALREMQGNGPPDTPSGPGDQNDLAVEFVSWVRQLSRYVPAAVQAILASVKIQIQI